MKDFIKLPEAAFITTGKLDSNASIETGKYPFFTCAPSPSSIDSYEFDCDAILLAGNNASANFHINRYHGKFNAYQRTYVITSKQDYNIDYLFYSLKIAIDRFKRIAQGSQTKFLTMDILNSFDIHNIDISEQIKNVQILKLIDLKISLNNRINTELERMAKTFYSYWFVQFDFPFDFAQGKPTEEVKPYKTSGGEMEYNEELKREIPKGWEVGTFNDIAEIIGGSTPSTENAEKFSFNGTAWITPKDLAINEGKKFITKGEVDVSDYGIKSASLKIMPKGTVLLSSRAPIGYMAISREVVTTNQGFKSFVPKKGYTSSFIFYTINAHIPTFIKNASGSTFKEISGSTLKDILIYIPPKYIIQAFSNKTDSIFEQQDILELENQELIQLRDFLLPLLMNGQVKVK